MLRYEKRLVSNQDVRRGAILNGTCLAVAVYVLRQEGSSAAVSYCEQCVAPRSNPEDAAMSFIRIYREVYYETSRQLKTCPQRNRLAKRSLRSCSSAKS